MSFLPRNDDESTGGFGDFTNAIMGAALSGPEGLFGRASSRFEAENPQDRKVRMQALSNAMANYDRSMSTPGGMVPEGYRKMLHSQSEEQLRSSRPGASNSAWLEDAVNRAKNQINLDLVKQELDQANQQRQYISQLMGMGQPGSFVPAQAGAVQQLGGKMFAQGAGDMFGLNEDQKKKKGGMGVAQQAQNPQGGNATGQTPRYDYGV